MIIQRLKSIIKSYNKQTDIKGGEEYKKGYSACLDDFSFIIEQEEHMKSLNNNKGSVVNE